MPITLEELESLYILPFDDLLARAHAVHRKNQPINAIQLCAGLSVKTGGCPEDCKFCQQSAHYKTGVTASPLMSPSAVEAFAKRTRDAGATRLCLGAAWRKIPNGAIFDQVLELIRTVKDLELEVCCSMGMLTSEQAISMKTAGCLEYNHNLDTSKNFYSEVITTRTYDDRLESIDAIIASGLQLSCGGIVGMGESITDRIDLVHAIASLKQEPATIPLNALVSCEGTPLSGRKAIDPFEFVRIVALLRITCPKAVIALAGGRFHFNESTQALAFHAGANAIYLGSKILTTPNNPNMDKDYQMIKNLGLSPLSLASA